MSFLYPDNQNRYNRVEGLANDISSVQQEVRDSIKRVDATNTRIIPTMNNIMKTNNMKTIDDMKNEVMKSLTPEQKQKYEKAIADMKGNDQNVDKILDASLLVAFLAGTTGLLVKPIVTLLDTGALAAGVNLVGRGLMTMIAGDVAVGARMMRAGIRTGRALATGVELTEQASRFVRFFRAAAKVLTVVSVLLDGAVLIYQAIEGAKQRAALQQGIKELVSRRLNCKELEQQIFAAEAYQGNVQGYLMTYDTLKKQGLPKESIDQVTNALTAGIIDNLKQDMDKITDQTVWDQLKTQDSDKNAWTNEDPSLADALAWIKSQPVDDQDG